MTKYDCELIFQTAQTHHEFTRAHDLKFAGILISRVNNGLVSKIPNLLLTLVNQYILILMMEEQYRVCMCME